MRGFLLLFVLTVAACEGEPQLESVVAPEGIESINLAQIDRQLALPLFDLQWRIYQLRRSALQAQLAQLKPQQSWLAEDLDAIVPPPQRPRLALPADGRAVRGAAAAAIDLAVFCSYPSSHCRRLQPILLRLVDRYEPHIGLRYFDFPQDFHRYARLQAEAVVCAHSQGFGWPLQDYLLARSEPIDRRLLFEGLAVLGVDREALQACLDGGYGARAVSSDIALAQTLRVPAAATSFVNGLYVRGVEPDLLEQLIEAEIRRLGLHWEPKVAGAKLPEVESSQEVEPAGRVSAVIDLPQIWLQRQLLRQTDLAAQWQSAEHRVEGHALLVLGGGSLDPFYQRLGFQPGDVLMQVDGQWVHGDDNSLFDVLYRKTEVEVVLMRRGLPIVYRYRTQTPER